MAIALVATPTFTVAQTNWASVASSGAPAPTCGFAWDSGRDRLVAFGGVLSGFAQSATREWNGTAWTLLNPPTRPSPRARPAMAYDEARGVTVLFAGSSAFTNDTWTFDGTTWTQQSPSNSPPVRFGAAMAYDKSRQVVVMFGGFVPSGVDANDLWEWDGSNWTLQSPSGLVPARRGAHRLAYDESLDATLLVGGYSTPQQGTLSDTWTWNGTVWTQHANMPNTRCDQALAYDVGRQRMVLFGGLRISGFSLTPLGDTWEWNGSWTQRAPAVSPTSRDAAACAYDPVNARFLVGGGRSGAATRNDTFAYSPVQPATTQSFGTPCAVTSGIQLQASTLPYLGVPFVQEIVNTPPTAAVGLVVFGASNTVWSGAPLPLDLFAIGAPGCLLLVSVDVANTVILSNGSGSTTWNIPNVPAAAGLVFYTQGVVLDPSSPLPLQIDMTAGLQCQIGTL